MKIVLLEDLKQSKEELNKTKEVFQKKGHDFKIESFDHIQTNDADIVIIGNHPFPKEMFSFFPELKLLAVAFTGLDHVDQDYAKEHGILICNASGYATSSVTELTISAMIFLLRKFDQQISCAKENKIGILGNTLEGKTVGILGLGKIGKQVATICQMFGANILYYQRRKEENVPYAYESLETLLKKSDLISLHCPFTKETNHLLSEKEFSLMKKGVYLINTARGGLLCQEDLKKALKEEKFAGVFLDVLEKDSYPSDLLSNSKVFITPHIGYYTKEAMKKRWEILLEKILEFIEKNTPY